MIVIFLQAHVDRRLVDDGHKGEDGHGVDDARVDAPVVSHEGTARRFL